MENLWKCPKETWDTYNENQKRLWNELYKVMKVTDYLPDGFHVGRGGSGIMSARIATRVMVALERAGVNL